MNIDIGKAIRELLYEHTAVMVPGLGGFTSEPAPAMVDYVQSVVLPPTKKLEFNPNLSLNDGILVNHIQKTGTVTAQEALAAIESYVENVHQTLGRGEFIEIPQIGRLYKDYEQKIRFLPEGVNFNLDAYALPTVPFSPVVRERQQPGANEPKPAPAAELPAIPTSPAGRNGTMNTPPPTTDTIETSPSWQRLIPWLVLVAAVLIAVSVFVIFSDKNSKIAANEDPVDVERLNVKPDPNEKANSTSSDTLTQPGAGGTVPQGTGKISPEVSDETETTTPDEPVKNEIFIIVHSFGVRKNARKFAQELSEAGYAANTQKEGTFYRVGVVLPQEKQSEVNQLINELAKKFKSTPKIFGQED